MVNIVSLKYDINLIETKLVGNLGFSSRYSSKRRAIHRLNMNGVTLCLQSNMLIHSLQVYTEMYADTYCQNSSVI